MRPVNRLILFVFLLIPAVACAQERPIVEIGTNLGITLLSRNESSTTLIGIPGLGFRGQPGMYATFFAADPVFVETQVGLDIIDTEDGSSSVLGFAALLGYFFEGAGNSSPFAAAEIGVQYQRWSVGDLDHSQNDLGFGAKFGYRFVLGRSIGLRVEAGYRRWFDDELNEFRFGVGLGAIVRRS